MTLSSALENVQQTTLHAIDGLLRKLQYLGSLQDNQGRYSHWGIDRVYGPSAAQEALFRAHRSVLSSVLATPISKLLDDIEKSSENAGVSQKTYAEMLASQEPTILPPNPDPGAELHLNSVLHALLSLIRVRNQHIDESAAGEADRLPLRDLRTGDSSHYNGA